MDVKPDFIFFDTSDLKTDEFCLRLNHTCGEQPEKQWLPTYYFDICLPDGKGIGTCDLRIGHNAKTYIGGNIGYRINEPFRGHHFAGKACRLLFRLAEKHGMDHLFITCQPDNAASEKTCLFAGGKFVGETDIPEDNEMYQKGKRRVRIFRFDIRHRNLKVSELSGLYKIRSLTENDVETVYALCRENVLYYRYFPPFVTPDTIRQDMQMLPPGKLMKDKHYLGYFDGGDLIAVLDLINGYPNPASAFIGFFMTAAPVQHQGIGSRIITELCASLKDQGFEEIRLCWVEGNPQAESFWKKNGFAETGVSYNTENHTVIAARKEL